VGSGIENDRLPATNFSIPFHRVGKSTNASKFAFPTRLREIFVSSHILKEQY